MKSSQIQSIIIWGAICVGYIIATQLTLNYKHSEKQGNLTQENLNNLRQTNGRFNWTLLPVLICLLHFYQNEAKNGNWKAIFAGIGFLTMDMYNEIWNALLFYYTDNYSAIWMCNHPSVYQILIGWNIEIVIAFFLVGLLATKSLPQDKNLTILGINNRHFFSFVLAALCVLTEILLNYYNALIWNFNFWNAKCPYLIYIMGYLPFFEICYYIYDLPTIRQQLSFIITFTGIAISLFTGCVLKGII